MFLVWSEKKCIGLSLMKRQCERMRNILDLLIDDFHARPLPELMPRQQFMAQAVKARPPSTIVGM